MPKVVMLFLLLLTFIGVITCECQESYMTICDSFDDFKNYSRFDSINELMIGSDHKKINATSVHLMRDLQIGNYNKLTRLVILGAINRLERTYAFQCDYENSPLKYLTLYGNKLETIEPYHFPMLHLKKFSLVNNKIDSIKSGALAYHQTEDLDLSDNLLEVIESGSLPSTNVTKIITIRNNKLTHIETDSFPQNLKSLNLDKNNFRLLPEEVFEKLNLKELTLSKNKFNKIPKICHMNGLVIFDISYNTISNVESGCFENMKNLKYLDLSNNKISSDLILQWLHTPANQVLTISLAFNALRKLDFTNVTLENKSLTLYGNPWDCKNSNELKKNLMGHESECDVEFSSSGRTPYCFDFIQQEYFLNDNWKRDVEKFHDAVRSSIDLSKCDLVPETYHFLYPIKYGCVA